MSMLTSTQKALPALPKKSTDSRPKVLSRELTGPVWGATWKNFWNSRPTATVGRTTGKKTRVRMSADAFLRKKT